MTHGIHKILNHGIYGIMWNKCEIMKFIEIWNHKIQGIMKSRNTLNYEIMELWNYRITRLLRCFAPIFYLNCEHVLFVYIWKQKQKKLCGFHEKFRGFRKFLGNRILLFTDFIKKKSQIFKRLKIFTKIKRNFFNFDHS